MSITFSNSQLIDIAIGIEKRGIAFYDIMAKSTDNAMARDVFQHLVNMEREHVQIFQGMLDKADEYLLSETSTGEYAGYVQSLVDSAVFTDDMITHEMATQADSDIKALELAIGSEPAPVEVVRQIFR